MEREITHSCGHAERHMVYGQYAADSDRKIRDLSRRKCTTCHTALKAAGAEADQALLEGIELPTLTGSEKQVRWAGTIRTDRLAKLRKADPTALARFTGIQEAKWWIDNRAADLRNIAF